MTSNSKPPVNTSMQITTALCIFSARSRIVKQAMTLYSINMKVMDYNYLYTSAFFQLATATCQIKFIRWESHNLMKHFD